MATLKQIRDKADAKLAEFWSLLSQKQDGYFSKHGKYFQLLVTDEVVDGVDTTFEVRKPSDEKYAVDVDIDFNSPLPFTIQVDEWTKGKEAGYSATVWIKLSSGDMYTRTREHTGQDTGWSKYTKINYV